ncbi:5-formyltetrahydrofolate cyclo-ligase [Chitinophaga dinghuensis]|uniref:5-formyltetrahydrofolate cyclo-ligase n=1 Tax=Chitinophaga dinghuensis TaxID=1539050 RepID=A0A327VXB4_9BACT|nr:5-formyltetrahydrofolate cyclo-ligase [Chitinophaga dinghuensis]RAJ79973.1 5-formyltetrahydrofolate cyclo-ligase [Chitinophaga dinghuensis]
MTTKKDIRKQFLEQRLNLDEPTATRLNSALQANVLKLNFSGLQYIHVFLPILEKKEADTWPIIEALRTQYPQLRWVLSRSDMQTATMTHFLWEQDTPLVKNSYGITEPAAGETVTPPQIDLVFVPLLAFDHTGHRVGYGKGMYDRFLQECRPDVQTIGLSLFEPIREIPDTNAGDIALQTVVTPENIYHFSKKD